MERLTMHGHWLLATVVLLLLSPGYRTQVTDPSPVDPQELDAGLCSVAQGCAECIALDPQCAWCADQAYGQESQSIISRCDLRETLVNQSCRDITFPEKSLSIEKNESLRDAGVGSSEEAVQVQPQQITLKLRPKETAHLTVSVRQAQDYPVDLYYVMDLSRSMLDDLNNLKTLALRLAREMGQITRNFRLGFGSFVEKTVGPFVDTAPQSLRVPCTKCEAPYNFRNHLPLDVNTDLFSEKVNETNVSGNLDRPEAGLDALMQITVCGEQIGWLPKARHLIVYTSDDSFHFAGDGKLGGIVQPNDGKCHLNPTTGYNDDANILDYPSIGHLNFRMRQQNIIPIFAVVSGHVSLYNNLARFIEGSTVGKLFLDSSNIVELIKDNYKKITSKIELIDNAPENLAVSYTARCLAQAPIPGSKECTGLGLGETVSFDVSIQATSCSGAKQQRFSIGPIGFDEAVEITVEVACSCECENVSIPNSDYCSGGNGTLSCGQCSCDPGRYGKLCECSSVDETYTSLRDKYENVASCRANRNSTSSIACSGRGQCICGECVCFERENREEVISGRFCECDNFSCERHNSLLCGGPDRGDCVCDETRRRSKCQCRPGHTGSACECATSTDACVASNGLMCNGQGVCRCNKCACFASSPFKDATCETCKTCIGKCSSYKPCVECQYFGVDISPADCSNCKVSVVVEKQLPTINGTSLCVFATPDGYNNCSLTYRFNYETAEDGGTLVHLEELKDCVDGKEGQTDEGGPVVTKNADSSDILILVLSIVAAIVLIGIGLLVLLRILTLIHDKREYARFEKEQESAVWDKTQNPIYKPSTSTYVNPIYGK